jgi:hypothetical protein
MQNFIIRSIHHVRLQWSNQWANVRVHVACVRGEIVQTSWGSLKGEITLEWFGGPWKDDIKMGLEWNVVWSCELDRTVSGWGPLADFCEHCSEHLGLIKGWRSLQQLLLGRKSSGSGLEDREYGRRDPLCWPHNTLYPQKLALTSPTSCVRSVALVCSRIQATEFTVV